MKQTNHASRRGALALAFLLSTQAHAAFTFTDIQLWAGSGTNQAALVIDWADGNGPLVWGYRWDALANPTGNDMLQAVIGVDSRLSVPGLTSTTNFVSTIRYDADNNGSYERSATGTSSPPFQYWGYVVNNAVFNHPTDFNLNSHIVPPATVVIPNGNPYAASSPGTWVDSSTGILARPLVNGSWDGFGFGEYNNVTFSGPAPGLNPIAATPIPEPAWLAPWIALAALLRRTRKRAATLAVGISLPLAVQAGPYAPGAGTVGTTAIPSSSSSFLAWANGHTGLQIGFYDIRNPSLGTANYGLPADAYGIADATTDEPYDVFSLGDGGQITMTFATPLGNGAGADFAVFENGFSNAFLELAYVEVSSNGLDFFDSPRCR